MSKEAVRLQLKNKRAALSYERRKEAAETLFNSLISSLAPFERVVSFMSLPDEIDTSLLNRYLATTHRLLLPKVVGNQIQVYYVTDIEKELEKQAFGLLEPIPALCRAASLEEVEVVLVPALGFDRHNHRLGYGKGYYDRFLSTLPTCPTIGLGFHEQLVEQLPHEETDRTLTHLSLF